MTLTACEGDAASHTVGSLLYEQASARPDKDLLVVDDARLSFAEAERRSALLARALLAAGAGWGTRVGILYPNGPEFVVSWLAAARIGAVTVPLSTLSTRAELVSLLRGVDASFLLATATYRSHDYVDDLTTSIEDLDLSAPAPLFSPELPSLRRIIFRVEDGAEDARIGNAWSSEALLRHDEAVGPDILAAAERSVSPADDMVIVHTSGSTSQPKGVIHTHGALIRHLEVLNRLRRYDSGEILFSNSPFFWIGGFAYGLLGTLVAGGTLLCSNAPSPGALDLLERERPTMVNGFAASVTQLAQDPTFPARDLSSIRRGNLYPIMPPETRPSDPELRHNMLGITEAGSVCLASDDEADQPERRRGSFGRPVPGFEASVRTPSGEPCERDQIGELYLRGPFVMEGYVGRERCECFDAENWYHTGDLVSVDEEGFFYFHGRADDMIKTSGANVSPREVEAAIAEVAGLNAFVVGVDDPNRDQIVAAVIRAPDDPSSGVDVEVLTSNLRARLSSYKVPSRILVVTEIPTMSSGKIDQRAIRAMLSGLEVET